MKVITRLVRVERIDPFPPTFSGNSLTRSSYMRVPAQGVFPGRHLVLASTTNELVDERENKFLGTARVSYARQLRRVTLQRYLVSRMVYEEDKVTFQDVLVLYDNLLWCQDKAEKDPSFQAKFGEHLKVLADLLKSTRFHPSSFRTTLAALSLKFRNELKDFVFPKRNLPGVALHVKGHYHILPHKESGVPKGQLPPKAYIGVGYKDKGRRRDPAYDGSPSWQDVAMRGKLL